MKKFLPLIFGLMYLTACQKSTIKIPLIQKSDTTSILLTTITDNIPGDTNKGNNVAELTYNGKELTKAVYHDYSSAPTIVETDVFNYNNSGILTGTTISNSQPTLYPDIKTTITYSGANISEITYYKANNVFDSDFKFTYSNNELTSYINRFNYGNQTIADTTYIVYDNNGNAIKFWDGHPSDNAFTQTTFDNYSNFTATVPYWVYFFTTPMYVPGMWVSPGKHNPVNYNYYNKGNYTYSYEYNSYGFPSSISSNAPFTYFSLKGVQYNSNEAYLYQYTKVN